MSLAVIWEIRGKASFGDNEAPSTYTSRGDAYWLVRNTTDSLTRYDFAVSAEIR
ncbi:MAG: hypothetical protein ACI9NC_006102 [Verrucomicrobiales bacterium]|jgi:hypothetical protein